MTSDFNHSGERNRYLHIFIVLLVCVFIVEAQLHADDTQASTSAMSKEEKMQLREKSLEMFDHAYGAYMDHAYPADELMPLSCKGRFRGSEPTRGDVDDTLGNFTLTLIDTLDTLAVLGKLDEFDAAVRNVIRDTRFDTDVVVSVFETNIRIVGGLLGGHVAAVYFKRRKLAMLWYHDELLTMAKEVGDRLLPAFNTTTGIPYARVNLRHGITQKIVNSNRDTCTSCAGTMILEFAALSRLTGIAVYEEKSRKAMDYLWGQRHRTNNLMGTVLNVHNGDWIRRESGVGAGIDSYYEYVLKAYVLLGDDTYLARFNKHYDGVMRYISQGPLLVDVHMHKPTSAARNFMDALLAFWPGLQVLVGDIGPAVETHEMLYQVVKRHNFLPEAFTTDFRVHWGQHPLRPEFVESTYFLYKATGDPYYLSVGKKVLENLEEHARVKCGFAAIKDIKRGTHEDQMDSFVLAETFKYLYLLFSDKSELALDVEDFVFTTEAHLLPLTLSVGNYSWNSPISSAKKTVRPDIYRFDKMSVAEMAKAAEEDYRTEEEEEDYMGAGGGVCRNYHVSVSEGPGYPHRLRYRLRDMVDRAHPPTAINQVSGLNIPRLRASEFVAANKEHLDMLRQMGIRIATMPDGRIQLLHTAGEAASQSHAEAGLVFMQEMIELSKHSGTAGDATGQHEPMYVRLLTEPYLSRKVIYRAGPAQFGYDLLTKPPVAGELAIASPIRACTQLDNAASLRGKIVIVERGDCMFVEKARNLQRAGAIGGVVMDQAQGSSSENLSLFAMSGDGTDDVTIPMVFLFWQQGQDLLGMVSEQLGLSVELTSSDGEAGNKDLCHEASPADSSAPAPSSSSSSSSSSVPSSTATSPSPPSFNSDNLRVSEPEGPGVQHGSPPSSSISSGDHPSYAMYGFYHQDFHDLSTGQYFLQAGTRLVHLSIEVSARGPHESDDDSRKLKFEPLPDGSKMMTFFLRHFVRHDTSGAASAADPSNQDQSLNGNDEGEDSNLGLDAPVDADAKQDPRPEKPNLNEMYLDVIHALQHGTNLESLAYASDYMKAIARFMEAAFFSLDRVDRVALEVMDRLAKEIKAKRLFPDGEVVYLQQSSHITDDEDIKTQQESVSETTDTATFEENVEQIPAVPSPQVPVPEAGNLAPASVSNKERHIQDAEIFSAGDPATSLGDMEVEEDQYSLHKDTHGSQKSRLSFSNSEAIPDSSSSSNPVGVGPSADFLPHSSHSSDRGDSPSNSPKHLSADYTGRTEKTGAEEDALTDASSPSSSPSSYSSSQQNKESVESFKTKDEF